MNEDYEGDFIQRRAIIYTLDFETRLRFYGQVNNKEVIQNVLVDFRNPTTLDGIERLDIEQLTPTGTITTQIIPFTDFN